MAWPAIVHVQSHRYDRLHTSTKLASWLATCCSSRRSDSFGPTGDSWERRIRGWQVKLTGHSAAT